MKIQRTKQAYRSGQPLNEEGFSYLEILLSVLILAIAVSAMLSAYSPAIFSGSEEETAVFANQARGTLNRLASLEFRTLDNLIRNNQADPVDLTALFGADETFTFRGNTYTPAASITNQGGEPGGLLELVVKIHHVKVRTLKSDH